MDKKRIFTCTPQSFSGSDTFFIRDTGLICRTLQSLGVESKAILLLPHQENEYPDEIIRTTLDNLKSVDWWKKLELDGVVLYSWGMRQYNGVARAIHKAGIKLVIHMDTAGNFDRLLPEDYTPLKAIKKWITSSIYNIIRARHLSYADVLTMSPPVAKVMSQMIFLDDSMVKKNYPMPCPVSPKCAYKGEEKKDIILCIGRWNDPVKRPQVLMEALTNYYSTGGTAETRFFGTLTDELRGWHSSLPRATADKVKLIGPVPNHKLWSEYAEAKIILCTSRSEATHCVSAEALCAGCSVVVSNRPAPLRVIHWYTSQDSGTISKEDTPASLAEAIHQELQLWQNGKRDPHKIAKAWQPYFHADKIMKDIFDL